MTKKGVQDDEQDGHDDKQGGQDGSGGEVAWILRTRRSGVF
jgi:hypothetical protein